MFSSILYLLMISYLDSCNFQQSIEIDTSKRLLQATPDYTTEEALNVHKRMEKDFKKNKIDLVNDYYMLFRYRDDSTIPIWLKILNDNPDNELLSIWFINAVSQMKNKSNLKFIAPFKNSNNGIIRECAANAYGFLGTIDSLGSLEMWLQKEPNCYVQKTLIASIKTIKTGGYKSQVSYLPRYYKGKPLKIQFIYNKGVNDDPAFQFEKDDTGTTVITSSSFIYPHQQYLWKIKYSPKAGTFASRHGPIFHVGMDNGWLLEGLPVHSICDGIVKQTSHNLSWGNLVVVETRTITNDTICIIYGHLSPFLNVKPGDPVRAGDKIGQIGNSVSYDNGGYWAHMHMEIEKRSFKNAGISGYDTDTSAYEDPIGFIKNHEIQK